MSTSVKVTVEQYEAMIDRGDFDPIEEHHVELIRGEIVPRFGDDPRIGVNPPHANAVNEVSEARVGGEMTETSNKSGAELTSPELAKPAESESTPAQGPELDGSRVVPLRSWYTPPGEEPVRAKSSLSRPLYAKDPDRPGLRLPFEG